MAGMKKAAGDGAEPELTGDLAKPGKRGGKKTQRHIPNGEQDS